MDFYESCPESESTRSPSELYEACSPCCEIMRNRGKDASRAGACAWAPCEVCTAQCPF